MSSLKILLVGIGGAGGRVLDDCSEPTPYKLLYVNTCDRSSVARTGSQHIVVPSHEIGIDGAVLSQRTVADLCTVIQGFDCVFLVAGLGGEVGTSLLFAIADLVDAKGIEVYSAAFIPFSFETERRALAIELLDRFINSKLSVHAIDLNDGFEKGLELDHYLYEVSKRVLGYFQSIVKGGDIEISAEDYLAAEYSQLKLLCRIVSVSPAEGVIRYGDDELNMKQEESFEISITAIAYNQHENFTFKIYQTNKNRAEWLGSVICLNKYKEKKESIFMTAPSYSLQG